MNLPLKIAFRYLFAKKSHNVINIISAISATGMAIGTAALVVILSVYNGFSSLVSSSLSSIEADILIEPSAGKVFVPQENDLQWLRSLPETGSVCEVLQENVFITYDNNNGVALAKGVDSLYEALSPVREHMVDGDFALSRGDIPQTVVGVGFAYKMGINHRFMQAANFYFPDRNKKISLTNPSASLRSVKAWPAGLFSITTDTDNSLMLLQLGTMRKLLGYDKEVSALEIRFREGVDDKAAKKVKNLIQEHLGTGFTVKDRYEQNETLYKMMRSEKAAVYLILIFVVIIIAFNIFGSLTMLIIEKQEDIATLRSLGARDNMIRRTFVLEGWLITLLGMAAGLVIGLLVVAAQQQFGFVKMPGDFSMTDYPVIIKWTDITITAISVAVIGYVIALVPGRKSTLQEGT
ncbi:MAG: ABC transporter permease [Bacteroidales bacterium]|nr:ABC transporter permease [Bacteroidales bacterium]